MENMVESDAKQFSLRSTGDQSMASVSDGLNVQPLWLTVSSSERYLLLEDTETGDILLPLIYMKYIFESNYSRKLSSLRNRIVCLPSTVSGIQTGYVYWTWAFESPFDIKVMVRKMIGEKIPHGHLRLILLPIVFNAMAQKAVLRESPFFKKLEIVLRASTYWPLLNIHLSGYEKSGEIESQKKHSSDQSLPWMESPLFHGPFDVEKTLQKYCLPFADVDTATDTRKPPSGLDLNAPAEDALNIDLLREQNEQILHELLLLRKEHARQMADVNNRLQEVKNLVVAMAFRMEKQKSQTSQTQGNPLLEQPVQANIQCDNFSKLQASSVSLNEPFTEGQLDNNDMLAEARLRSLLHQSDPVEERSKRIKVENGFLTQLQRNPSTQSQQQQPPSGSGSLSLPHWLKETQSGARNVSSAAEESAFHSLRDHRY